MRRLGTLLLGVCLLLPLPEQARAQSFGSTGTTSLAVSVGSEAAIRIDTATSNLTTTAGTFSADYTGTTAFTYKIRTSQSGGTGTITVQITSDFNGTGGPSVANPPTPGDTLAYTCTVSNPGTGCTGSVTSSTTSATSVATFGADAKSARNGNSGSLAWTLTNDPMYSTGSYTATATFTISAT